jgi:hypothetical protein
MHRFAIIALGAGLAFSTIATGQAPAQIYGTQALPAGSYQQSCINARVRNNMLIASCTNTSGQRVRSTINVNACRSADIGNINGQLSCVRNGNMYGQGRGRYGRGRSGLYNQRYTGGLPPGSYQQSCRNETMSGSTLTATCTAANGQWVTSYLDVSQCRSTDDVGNDNGQLRCIYRGY